MNEPNMVPPPLPHTDSGMNAVLAAWHHRRTQYWTAAVLTAQGFVAGPVERQPGTGAVGIEGQKPGVEEQKLTQPELLIPSAIIGTGDKVAEGQLIEAVALPWFDILKELERNPDFLHQLDWRKVEELIAGAYTREGWPEVILTPRSGDGGRDIIVSKPGVGAIRFYDQVKAYSPGHKVPAKDVRELAGVLTRDQNVSKAVITTTALFAPGVHEEWKAFIPYRLELKDGPRLRDWLMGLGGSADGPHGPKGGQR
jgi:restriction system protein